jgi:hypothetical protein
MSLNQPDRTTGEASGIADAALHRGQLPAAKKTLFYFNELIDPVNEKILTMKSRAREHVC